MEFLRIREAAAGGGRSKGSSSSSPLLSLALLFLLLLAGFPSPALAQRRPQLVGDAPLQAPPPDVVDRLRRDANAGSKGASHA
jgi:hypothetical protein